MTQVNKALSSIFTLDKNYWNYSVELGGGGKEKRIRESQQY
jgi:hypothetical protein